MSKSDWNPELYLKYNCERLQPSIDLVHRIDLNNPGKIIDIGCGPGNSTQVLAHRWPNAKIIGVDNSSSMIEKAQKDFPDQEWMLFDAGKDTMKDTFDIVYSNAAIQWIPDHSKLLERFYNLTSKNGVIAVQIPLFWEMELGKSIAAIAANKRWSQATREAGQLFTIYDYAWYYNQLSAIFSEVNIWETHYMHVMESHDSILEMIKSTGLKPYLERLNDENDRFDFEQLALKSIQDNYPEQENKKVIFPFKRLFFTARK